jgi:sugar phosphate isomerase/epimerase
MALSEARRQALDSIATLIPYAQQAGVKMGIEPLHPMYSADRSAVNTLTEANDIAERLRSPQVGVVVDAYHLWWDERLEAEIARAGRLNALLAYHICDWRPVTRDILLDRGLMGEGCIPLRQIRTWMEKAGFQGMIEIEILSTELWKTDQNKFLQRIRSAYLEYA